MRLLITGAGGQLGRALVHALAGEEVAALSHAMLDVTDRDAVRAAFREARPDAVIHCAALTDTALCERDALLAHRVNAEGTQHVASECDARGARLLAISTNEVFDGESDVPYAEDAEPQPLNNYGSSKLSAEEIARQFCPGSMIVRTAWLYGGPSSFVTKTLVRLRGAVAEAPARFVTDEVGAPTSCDDLAAALARLTHADAPEGVYHLTNGGEASRYDWAVEIARLAGIDAELAHPCTTDELRAAGYEGPRKPPYSVLANTRAAALGIRLRPWRDALRAHMAAARTLADG